jgi:hypothetical protein
MGRYPRKGADWSPEEDQALLRAYESGRYLTKEIASRHLREPVAIERRLSLLRDRAQMKQEHDLDTAVSRVRNLARNWQTERETAQQAVAKIKGLFSASMWPRQQGNARVHETLRSKFKVGDVFAGGVVKSIYDRDGVFMISWGRLDDLPPEVAQALQFGGES